MATMKIFIIVVIAALVVPPALAKEFVVGDNQGWSIGVNYETWAEANDFRVGDTLVFKYTEGAHNVHGVNETEFQQCVAPGNSQPLESGHDVITLTIPGKKWYICGVGQHCELGNQKLVITVLPQLEPSASSSTPNIVVAPPSAAADITASKYYIMISAAFAFFIAIKV